MWVIRKRYGKKFEISGVCIHEIKIEQELKNKHVKKNEQTKTGRCKTASWLIHQVEPHWINL